MRVKLVRTRAGPDGVELHLHDTAGELASDDGGVYLRVELGARDVASVLGWAQLAFPDGVEAHRVGHECSQPGCPSDPTRAEDGYLGHIWCDAHGPDSATRANLARPQRLLATLEGVRFYLRSAYGMNSLEAAEAIRCHPYTIQMARSQGMSVEAVSVDIARRVRGESGRLRLEAQATKEP